MFMGFLMSNGMFTMNSFFNKSIQRKWTWASPDGVTKNETNFVINKKNIAQDVAAINNF